jgi:hypothetical protein
MMGWVGGGGGCYLGWGWGVTYRAVLSIPALPTDTGAFITLALNAVTARVTVLGVTQNSAPALVADTPLVVAESVYTT